jgi:hypothetical protein
LRHFNFECEILVGEFLVLIAADGLFASEVSQGAFSLPGPVMQGPATGIGKTFETKLAMNG